jgi:membrane protein
MAGKMDRKLFLDIAGTAFQKWLTQKSSLRAAALTYFMILPLPLLLLIILGILAVIYGQADAFQALIQQITTIAGPAVADLMRQLLDAVKTPFTSVFASLVSLGFTVAGAVGAFGVLQETMNSIWDVPQLRFSFGEQVKRKIVPFLLVSVLGFAIMVWTGVSAVLFGFITFALESFASNLVEVVLRITQIGLSFVLSTLLFAVIYKQIPDLAIQWGDVGLAAVITGILFTVTNYLIGIVLEVFTITSVTGAAGSLLILLPWFFLINQFILYGATFSRVYAEKAGSYSLKQPK